MPVDAIPNDALVSQGSGDMSNLLRTAIPAFHVSTATPAWSFCRFDAALLAMMSSSEHTEVGRS